MLNIKLNIKFLDSIQIENDSKIEHNLRRKQEYFRGTAQLYKPTPKEKGKEWKPFNLHNKDILNFVGISISI